MSKIFKLRRGTTSTMNSTKSNILLSSGEMFLEVPSSNSGNGDCRIKVGDGSSQYSDLSYAIGGPNMTFRDNEIIQQSGTNISSTTTTTSSSISTITTASNNDLSYVTSGYSLSQIIGSIKSAITRTNQGLTKLNSSLINSTIYHTFTTITSFGYEDINYPNEYTQDNTFVERFEIETIEGWRGGENVTNGGRCFYILMSDKIRLYSYINNSVRMTISKRTTTDITL